MDLHLLTYFLAVVDHGGVTKAARALFISQPSLSQSIRTLERNLGTSLFDRVGRRLVLTEAGLKLETSARDLIADVDRARKKMSSIRTLESATLDMVTFAAFSIHPTVELVRRSRSRHPGITLRISEVQGPSGVHAALRRGEAELGITDLTMEYPGMVTIPLCAQELVLALPAHLAVDLPDPVPRKRVREVPLVVDLSSSAASPNANELYGNIVIDCAHPMAIWEFVRRGAGATVVPRAVATQQLPDAVVRAMDPPVLRQVGLLLRAETLSPAAAAFVAVAGRSTAEN